MARVFISGVEGRQSPPKEGKPGRYFGKIYLVRGRASGGEGVTGCQTDVIDVGEELIIQTLRPNVPGFFELDSGVEVAYGEKREKVFGVDHLGGEAQWQFTVAGIVPRAARQAAVPANGAAGAAPQSAARV